MNRRGFIAKALAGIAAIPAASQLSNAQPQTERPEDAFFYTVPRSEGIGLHDAVAVGRQLHNVIGIEYAGDEAILLLAPARSI